MPLCALCGGQVGLHWEVQTSRSQTQDPPAAKGGLSAGFWCTDWAPAAALVGCMQHGHGDGGEMPLVQPTFTSERKGFFPLLRGKEAPAQPDTAIHHL